MYLHIGGSYVVRQQDIIGIFDLDNTSYSRITRDFLASAERKGRVFSATDDLPKSFVLCRGLDGEPELCLSQLSSATLWRRLEAGGLNL